MRNPLDKKLNNSRQRCNMLNLRLTKKREQVLNIMLIKEQALSAYELIDIYWHYYDEKISAVSMYRILDFLIHVSLVHKLSSSSQYLACSHTGCASYQTLQFLICDHCHRVKEFGISDQLTDELATNIANHHFQLTQRQLELHGICQNCQ